jgi:hypothetical protein
LFLLCHGVIVIGKATRKDVQAGGGELAHLREGDDTDDTMTPNRYH